MSQPDLVVRAGAVSFFGQMPHPGYGFLIGPDGLEGLDDGVAAKGETLSRVNADGDFDVPMFLESRIVSVSGRCLADSPERLAWFGSALTGLMARSSERVVFDHMGRVRAGVARLAPGSTTRFAVNGAGATDAEFQIQMKFADPRLYGESRTSSGAEYVSFSPYHMGNFPATPVYTVAGSMASGYQITGPDEKVYRVTRPLVDGAPHSIDMATGLLSIGGSVVVGGVEFGDTWTVLPGVRASSRLAPIGGAGSGVLTATVRDTFL